MNRAVVGVPPHVAQPPVTSMRRFWALTAAAAVSKLGNTFLNLAAPWAVLEHTHSAVLAALSLGVQYLPYIFSIPVGALIDRFDRRLVYSGSEILQGLAVAACPPLLASGHILLVLPLLLLVGCGSVVSSITSDFSLVPSVSPPDRLAQAYSHYTIALSLGRCLGPALAGTVTAVVGVSGALWIDAATFLATAGVALSLPRQTGRPATRGFGRMLAEGFATFRRLPGVPHLTAALAFYNLGAGAIPTILVVLAKNEWHWSAYAAGLVLTAGAAGNALGAWLGPRRPAGLPLERRIGRWLTLASVAGLVLLLPGAVPALAGFVFLMIAEGAINVSTNELRATLIPAELVGRVNAIMRTAIITAGALSAFVLGGTVSLNPSALHLAPIFAGAALSVAAWAARPPGPDPNPGLEPERS